MDIIANVGFWLLILLGLSVVVFLHEGGHFLAARWAGVEVEAFAIGWGKVLFSWKPGVTEYRICLFPIGGYCKMKGEQDMVAAMGKVDGQIDPTPGSLFSVPAWKRIVISAAGPVANLLTALALFIALALVGTPTMGPESRILLASEVDGRTGTAAEEAGLKSGDSIVAIDQKGLRSFADLQTAIVASDGRPTAWTVERDGLRFEVTVTPKKNAEGRPVVGVYPFNPPRVKTVDPQSPAGLAGLKPLDLIVAIDDRPVFADQIVFAQLENRQPSHKLDINRQGQALSLTYVSEGSPTHTGISFLVPTYPAQGLNLVTAASVGTARTFDLLGQMVAGLGRLFVGKEDPIQSLSGPVGIVGQGGKAMAFAFGEGLDFGFSALVTFLSFLSLALFLMNLLPIPALDGGTIVVSLLEMVRRRRLGIRALLAYQQVGVVVVLGLLLFTTLNDLGLFGKH